MKNNLFTVAVYSPKGSYERRRSMRLIGGELIQGNVVTMAPDALPFKNRQYRVIGRESDGTVKVQVR